MAREIDENQTIDLFPMFNILLCALGLLIFVLCAYILVAFSVEKAVTIFPASSSQQSNATVRTPVFLEWDGRTLMLHPTGDTVEFTEDIMAIKAWDDTYTFIDKALRDTQIGKKFDEVSGNSLEFYFIVLVRPSGFDSLYELCGYIQRHRKIEVGYEPINQHWRLNLGEITEI